MSAGFGAPSAHTLQSMIKICVWQPLVSGRFSFAMTAKDWPRMPPGRTKIFLIFLTLVGTLFLYIEDGGLSKGERPLYFSPESHPMANRIDFCQADDHGSISCQVPCFHPLDKAILCYYRPPPPAIRCKKRELELSRMDLDSGQVEVLPEASPYQCSLEDVLRHGDNYIKFGLPRPLPIGKTTLEPVQEVQAVRVQCRNFLGLIVYSHIHLVVPHVSLSSPFAPDELQRDPDRIPQNVFIFGIDSVSRLAALRLLPRTYNYLVNNLSAVVLRSHHKVGENTFPNLITILTGDRRVHPADTPDRKKEQFDEWPLIWQRFADEGYETFYGEDFPKFSTFNYLAEGFVRSPTHHYLRPFWLAVEDTMLSKTSSLLCYGNRPKYQLQLDYLKYVLKKKRSAPIFAFSFLVEISHEYQELVGAADNDFVELLELLKTEVDSGQTLLLFLSDHGHRFDAIRSTAQGHVEERLPFVAIATADVEKRLVLGANANLLTSHYDLHEILRSVLPPRSRPRKATAYGIDILREHVPKNRTCTDAGVADVYCTCLQSDLARDSGSSLDRNDAKTTALAVRAVDFINRMLHKDPAGRTCERLSLNKVRSVFTLGSKKVLTFDTVPGDGVFELRIPENMHEPLDETMYSRINRYGTPCIPNQTLRKYCFCNK